MPDCISLDISELKIGDKIYVREVETNNFDILTSGNAVIVAVKTARNIIEDEEEEIEEEGAEQSSDGDAPSPEVPPADEK